MNIREDPIERRFEQSDDLLGVRRAGCCRRALRRKPAIDPSTP
jgi:hypothetical protein